MDISIIIPTKNRYIYLKKLINYYDDIKFKGTLIIIDSSDHEDLAKTKILINQNTNLSINYVVYQSDEIACKFRICKDIKSKYVVQSGDDDYYAITGLRKIIKFLDKNKDYIAASGYGYTVGYNLKNNIFKGISKYNILCTNKNNPLERVKDWKIKGNVADYTVCKSEVYQKILENIWYDENFKLYLLRTYWEYTFKFYIFLYGKSSVLDTFYMVRLRIPENSLAFPEATNLVYLNNKRSFLKAYFFSIKKLKLIIKNLDDKDSQEIFLLAKKNIKKEIYMIIKKSKVNLFYNKLNMFKNLAIAVFSRLFSNKDSILSLISKNSNNYKEDFAIIIESIKK